MARLATIGPLTNVSAINPNHPEAMQGATTPISADSASNVTYATSPVRSPHGRYSFQASGAGTHRFTTIGSTNGRAYFVRMYINVTGFPAAVTQICNALDATPARIGGVGMNTDGTLGMFDSTATQIGVSSPVLATGWWYRIEFKIQLNASPTTSNGILEARLYFIDDAQLLWNPTTATANLGTAAGNVDRVHFGALTTFSPSTINWMDMAVNDDQGANQNTWPGRGSVGFLRPVSDGTRVGWTAGGGGTASLFSALNNSPPIGVATPAGWEQIKDATNNSTDTFIANCAAYSASAAAGGAGITAADNIVLLQAMARVGNNSTTSRLGAVRMESNPGAGTEVTTQAGTTAAAADPTGWRAFRTAPVYNPTPTLGTQPAIRVRKGTASTDTMFYDMAGIVVEFQRPLALTALDTFTVSDAVGKGVGKAQDDTLTNTDAVGKGVGKAQDDTLTNTDAVDRAWTALRALADTITVGDDLAKSATKAIADTLTNTDVLARSAVWSRALADTLTNTDALGKAAAKAVADALTISDAVSKGVGWTAADTITPSDAVVKGVGKAVADTLTNTEGVAKGVGKAQDDTLTNTDALSKRAAKVAADTITISDGLVKGVGKGLVDTITNTEGLAKSIFKNVADSLTNTDAVSKAVRKTVDDPFTVTDAVGKAVRKTFDDALTVTDALAKGFGKLLDDGFPITDALDVFLNVIAIIYKNLRPPADGIVLEVSSGGEFPDTAHGAGGPDNLTGGTPPGVDRSGTPTEYNVSGDVLSDEDSGIET